MKEIHMVVPNEVNPNAESAQSTTYIAPLSGFEVRAHTAEPAKPTAEELAAAQARKIAELETALAAQVKLGNNSDVQLPDGQTLSVKAATKELSEVSVDAQLEIMKSHRFIAELADQAAAATPKAASRTLLDKDSAVALVGRTAWEKATNAEKAMMLDTRQIDVDGVNVEDIFGPKSSSLAAHELGRKNPALYKIVKAKAKKRNLI